MVQTIKAITTALFTREEAQAERTTAMAAETWPEKVAALCRPLMEDHACIQ